ncbi:MAG: TniB family NTP-binding protein [Acidobacteria bacterium]|nr:TniB family NTP-binding protein [Acidobacteriota bacterium]
MTEQLLEKTYEHLGELASQVIEAEPEARKAFIRQTRWVGYSAARKALGRMEEILQGPRVDRMECMLIIGDTNNGKTRLIKHFLEKHPPKERADGGSTESPVLFIQAPPSPDEKRLYASILSRLGSPVSGNQSAGSQYSVLEKAIRGSNLKMLIIDEIQHLVCGSTNKHRECMTALKFIANDLRISIVAAGIRTAHYAIASFDTQIENRFKGILLPRWTYGEELTRLLLSIEKLLPLRAPSHLGDPKLARLIAELGDGKIGEIWTLLRLAAIEAIDSGKECIDMDGIKSVEGIAPAHRRALLHGTD